MTLTARQGYSIVAPRAQLAARPGDSIAVLAPLEAKHVLGTIAAHPGIRPRRSLRTKGTRSERPRCRSLRAPGAGFGSATAVGPAGLIGVGFDAAAATNAPGVGFSAVDSAAKPSWRVPVRRSSPP